MGITNLCLLVDLRGHDSIDSSTDMGYPIRHKFRHGGRDRKVHKSPDNTDNLPIQHTTVFPTEQQLELGSEYGRLEGWYRDDDPPHGGRDA